ncbi:NAD(P)-dependent alcohol dehydrogenase [Aquihabitans sp. McL0605]|uniref:NAD(P)-dependent alcohol dehydrogenase n=1 Tax=Aquihabitans sp. McL0605 TaxID=3415671 RepID=UPI003CEE58A8
MRAVVQDRYGSDPDAVLAVAEVARPAIGADDVLVRVAAAGVDMGTWHCMTGMPYAMRLTGFGLRSPSALNPGRGLAGTVEAVGSSVSSLSPGDEVYGSGDGSFAEYASVPADQLARKPWNLTFVQSAAVPISGATALQALRKAGTQPGQRVLVIGASGGVGSFAVQIAKAMGAVVTGVCSTPKVDFVEALGADRVVDYLVEDVDDGSQEYDVIIDIGGSRRLPDLRRALDPRGTLVIVGGETGGRWLGGFDRSLRAVLISPFVGQTLGLLASTEEAASLDDLRGMIESGQVTPAIDRTFPMADVAGAVRHVEEGRPRGKVVITI